MNLGIYFLFFKKKIKRDKRKSHGTDSGRHNYEHIETIDLKVRVVDTIKKTNDEQHKSRPLTFDLASQESKNALNK